MNTPFVSIIIPVYRQAEHIGYVIDRYERELARTSINYEMILVVNGCKDDSLDVYNELRNRYQLVRVFHIPTPGWGRAVKFGLKEASGDVLCYTNSARTSEKDLILALLYSIANPDVVIKANRKIRASIIRRLGSLLYNIECRALFNLSDWDINGTPKVFPRKFDKLLTLSRDDNLIDLEFDIICKIQNYPMLEIPILSSQRHGGRSTTGFRAAIEMYVGALKMWYLLKKHSVT